MIMIIKKLLIYDYKNIIGAAVDNDLNARCPEFKSWWYKQWYHKAAPVIWKSC